MKREIIEKHVGPSWVDFMAPHMQSEEFKELMVFLKNEKDEGKKILPAQGNIFRCFRETPLDKVRVVIIGQDPYPKERDASGLAFSVDRDSDLPVSMQKMFNAIEKDCYDGLVLDKLSWSGNLTRWTEQGVLLLNSALTVVENTPGSHKDKWKSFASYVIGTLNQVKKDVIYIACGTEAQDAIRDVNIFLNYTLMAEHPSFAAREKREWDFKNCFSKTNAIITANQLGDKINW